VKETCAEPDSGHDKMNLAPQRAALWSQGLAGSGDPVALVLTPPMPRQTVLRIMILGFGLVVLLVVGAAYLGYQGSRSIRDTARDLVQEHALDPNRGAVLESRIEAESQDLLDELIWILGACFVLAVVGSALTIWTTHRAFRRLEWQAAELNQVSWHMVDTHEKMARRFSHEMHDELGQALTGLKGMLKSTAPAELDSKREAMVDVLDDALNNVRELSQLLRPVILDDFGLDAGLRWLTERFSQRTGIAIEYSSNFNQRLAEPLETHLFRIAQEALTNIARHSGATQARVHLNVTKTRVQLTIEDNGTGIPHGRAASHPSLGMVGMRARAREVNGELNVENRPEGGLRIRADAPFAGPQDAIEQEDARITG
jgi:signal transduction histidine kinase